MQVRRNSLQLWLNSGRLVGMARTSLPNPPSLSPADMAKGSGGPTPGTPEVSPKCSLHSLADLANHWRLTCRTELVCHLCFKAVFHQHSASATQLSWWHGGHTPCPRPEWSSSVLSPCGAGEGLRAQPGLSFRKEHETSSSSLCLDCVHGPQGGGGGEERPNKGTGILFGNIQARCPCGWFKETKPPNSHHLDPLTWNTHIPKEPFPAGNKNSRINTDKLEMVISKKAWFSSVLEEQDGTANCRFGRTHLSPFSMLVPPLWLIKRCYKFILFLFSTTGNKNSGYLKSVTESIICKSKRIRTLGVVYIGLLPMLSKGKKQAKYIKNHLTLFLTSYHKVIEKYKTRI